MNNLPTKPITQSKTTKIVGLAVLLGAGSITGFLAAIREAFPELMPWSVEADAAVATTISVVVVPVLSRALAFWKTRVTRTGARSGIPY